MQVNVNIRLSINMAVSFQYWIIHPCSNAVESGR